VYKRDFAFRMTVIQEIFESRSCIEILANDIKVDDTTDQYVQKKPDKTLTFSPSFV